MSTQKPLGAILYEGDAARKADYLYRISLKCLIRDSQGKVLVVKETGRDWWDLPGGGMDHGESISKAIAREMEEEVGMQGAFDYRIIEVDEPGLLERNLWQIRLIFEVVPRNMTFVAGEDGDEIAFIDPEDFKDSSDKREQRTYRYSVLPSRFQN